MKSNLNEKQKKAVNLGLGPALILAGPGSGKTTVILERIKHLIFECNISPGQILVITYTRAAAKEMKDRAANLLNNLSETPVFATFHSYFYSVLKRSYEYRSFSISTEKQKLKNLERLLKSHYPTFPTSKNFMRDVLSCISKYKNDIAIQKELERLGFQETVFFDLCKNYDYFNREQKLMDYDDILLFSHKLFLENPEILTILQKEIGYILIDEFQDVNKIQYDLVCLLAGKRANLFVVGDDDQSIYKFRGAGEENLQRFEQDFPSGNMVTLDINYRCPKEIVVLSKRLIEHNESRFFKELCSAKKEDGNIICKCFEKKEMERAYIVETIKERLKGTEKMALLCRTNSQLSYFSELLKKEKIPFYKREKTIQFYEIPWVKTVIGYLLFASGIDRSRKILFTFLNEPLRYIKREWFIGWDLGKKELKDIIVPSVYDKETLKELEKSLKIIGKLPPQMAVSYILKVIGYETYMVEKCKTKEELDWYYCCMEELVERAKMYSSLKEWLEYIKWEEQKEDSKQKETLEKGEKVCLYTFHASKGLEFDTVFIPHLNEGSVPYGKKLTKEEMEEERRMFYVALTRSISSLYITYVENGTKKDTVSPFLQECGLTASKH